MKKRENHWNMMKKQGQKTMKNDDQERKKTRNTYEKEWQKMKHDEKEKKQWKMMKKRETKTMKND